MATRPGNIILFLMKTHRAVAQSFASASFVVVLGAAAMLLGLAVSSAFGAPPFRIMPLGDSITDGVGAVGGYRLRLYQLMTNAGFNVDFVGTQNDNGAPGLPDSDHEGHSGYRIDQIDAGLLGYFGQNADPDIILVLIGTNDYGQGYDTPHATNRLEALIVKIATNRPFAKVIVANLLVRGEPYNTQIQRTFNPFVPGIVARQAALGRQVYFTDLRSAVPLADFPDQLHPGALGYSKMATNWFNAITSLFTPDGSTNAPALAHAYGLVGLTNILVTFSKPVADDATNLANFAVSGGVTVVGAVLDSVTKRDVTLSTSLQAASSQYTLTVNGVRDGTANQTRIAPDSALIFWSSGSGGMGVFNNVREAAGYQLVYSLNIPNNPVYTGLPVPYAIDLHSNISTFSRVAYYLELQVSNRPLNFIWVSLDALTNDVTKIGVPTLGSRAAFQQPVSRLNVLSSQPGIVNGTHLAGGNIEFWPNNYTADNTANVPNANGLTFDWGDSRSPGNYGSMQIHNHDAGQVLFAFNRWGGAGGRADLGIGTRPSGGDPDWTFAQNAATYVVKTLQVLVNRPPVAQCADVIVSAGTNCMAEASADNGSFNPDGDPFTVTQSPPGPYPLGTNLVTVTVTDHYGVSNSCAARVIVLDTTPPALTCPSNLTLEFTSEAGAPTAFTPEASDLCSPPVTVTCVPPSGSTFPIGTTEVRCTATDRAGNSAGCSFQVNVLGAQGVKSNVLTQLIALRGSLSNPKGREELNGAIHHLSLSLEAALWLDQTHLVKRHGERAFQEERAAVQELWELLRSRHGGGSNPVLQGFIERIVKADRLLAVVAIQDALNGGVNRGRLAEAQRAVAQGDKEAANAKYAPAIEHYRNAWQHGMRLTIKVGGHVVNGRLCLELPALPGDCYEIEVSTNLLDWVTVGTATAGEDGLARFESIPGGHGQAQFYRVRLLP